MNESQLIEQALQAIQPVLEGRLAAWEPGAAPGMARRAQQGSQARIELHRPGRRPIAFLAEVRRVERTSDLAWHAMHAAQRRRSAPRPLLVAPHVSAQLAEECRQAGIHFLDAAGNAHIDVPGLYLYITGRKPAKRSAAQVDPSTLRKASTLRVIFALLTIDGLVLRPVREIAQSAGVALGSTSEALAELQALGFLSGGARQRRLANRVLLITEWARQYPIALRDKLQPLRCSCASPEGWRSLRLDPAEAVWGAEMAAAALTDHLVPERACLYAWADRRALMLRHRLRPDPNGAVEILDAFWPRPQASPSAVAPALLVYADLMASNDGRNREVAKLLEAGLRNA